MKPRRAILSLGLAMLMAWPAMADTDDQKKKEVAAKPATQDGFRICNLSGQPVEVAKATYSAKRATNEAFVAEGWYQFEPTDTVFEDSERNLEPAAELGMTTVLVGANALESQARFVHHRTLTLPPFLAAIDFPG